MQWDEIFAIYYTLYRAEAQVPTSTDDEYTIALALAKEAVNAWRSYDNTYWRELFVPLSAAATGTKIITSGTATYAAPTDMQEYGGGVTIRDLTGAVVRRYKLIEPHEAQFLTDYAPYCYFTGDPNNGFTLHINSTPDSTINLFTIDYIYYKKPTYFTTGTSMTEMADPMFIVHRMLANRFRASRNPYYNTAKGDAENALRQMQLTNNSGTWDNPWLVPDRSGTQWGS